jgi:hypothetical protein
MTNLDDKTALITEAELVDTTSAIDAIGRALHECFTERHAAGDQITPEASAAALPGAPVGHFGVVLLPGRGRR